MRLTLALLCAAVVPSAVQAQAGLTTLTDLKDHARPLLIFAAKPDDPQLIIQLRALREHAAEVQERQIVPVGIVYSNPSPTDSQFTATEAESVRRRFGVAPNDFAVILLGKDGGEKLRSAKPLSILKLSDTIDAMPMRQHEMKAGSAKR